ncbi:MULTISPECIES: Coq4 family protein [unclassified Sphingomonas]|uniref:Coq4 family protein n=1 Tax=unclassified Sphingomonas TaxID=196159 RepID=UPI00082F0D13|nr:MULTISPECIES: Coq4 family protein [unclassified Sphingomonas]
MATTFDTNVNPGIPTRRDWGAAWRALRRLLADGNDTVQVFRIMRALNGDTSHRNYRRLLSTPQGGRIAYARVELARRFADREWLASLPADSVGAAYLAFLDRTGFSPDGLADIANADNEGWRDAPHPYAWFGRRERDIHDIWHVLTGYTAEEHLGEACLVAFSYAQTGGLGWAFIGAGAALKSLRVTGERHFAAAVWEGYRHGRRAAWLHAQDYEALLAEPLAAARRRLDIAEPVKYRAAQARLAEQGTPGI